MSDGAGDGTGDARHTSGHARAGLHGACGAHGAAHHQVAGHGEVAARLDVGLHLEAGRLDPTRPLDGVAGHVEISLHPVALGEARNRDTVERIAEDAAVVEAPQRPERALGGRAREGGPEGGEIGIDRRTGEP